MKKPRAIGWIFEGECIRCTSHRPIGDATAYVYTFRNGRFRSIPRQILIRRHGELPHEIVSRHTCDNKWCINPAHLLVGTQADNTNDMVVRGRTRSKLTPVEVSAIRNSSESTRKLARLYGMSRSNVQFIKHGRTHKLIA